MKKMLFLDDWREPAICATYMGVRGVNHQIYHGQWEIVRSYGQFIKWITENGMPDFISFDHDLGDVDELKENLDVNEWFDLEGNKEYTGMDCARWLTNYCMDNGCKMAKFAVHSDNPGGRENIAGLINNYVDKIENG